MKLFADLMVLVFVVASVLSVALTLTVSQILVPLRQARLVAQSLVANFLIVPASAVAITNLMALEQAQSVGLILLGVAAGAPFLPKLIEVAKGDIAYSVALMVLLMVGSLVYLPLVLPFMLPGTSVDPLKIVQSLFFTMILPLCIGLCIRARRESFAVRLRPFINALSNASLVIVLVLVPAMNWQSLVESLDSRAVLAIVAFIGLAFGAGYFLGGHTVEARRVLSMGTAARNIPAALLVGRQNFDDPHVAVIVIVVALLSLILLVPPAVVFGRRAVSNRLAKS